MSDNIEFSNIGQQELIGHSLSMFSVRTFMLNVDVLFKSSRSMSLAQKIKATMIDLSGTLHIEDTAIDGARETLEKYVDRERGTSLNRKS